MAAVRTPRPGMSLEERLQAALDQLRFWEMLFDADPAASARLWLTVGLVSVAAPPHAFRRAGVAAVDLERVGSIAAGAVSRPELRRG